MQTVQFQEVDPEPDDKGPQEVYHITNTSQRIDQYEYQHHHQKRLSLWDELSGAVPDENMDDDLADFLLEYDDSDVIVASPVLAEGEEHFEDEDEEEEDDEDGFVSAVRASWTVNDVVLIYSRSQQHWFDGVIESIKGSTKHDEWLMVRYGKNRRKVKKIQRACRDIKAIAENHPCFFKTGSQCKIYSTDTDSWCFGQVIQVIHDQDGEWLNVKYKEEGKYKVCDIQRFSEDIQLIV